MKNQKELPTDYQNFIALSRYARWLPDENRREVWSETVDRYMSFMENHLQEKHSYVMRSNLKEDI